MTLWEAGDLIVPVDGSAGNRRPAISVWEMPSGYFKGLIELAPPLTLASGRSIGLGAMHPDNTYLYGHSEDAGIGFNARSFVRNNGLSGFLEYTGESYASSLEWGQAFDLQGNRYLGDFILSEPSNTEYRIKKIAPDNTETIFTIDPDDPNMDSGGSIDILTLRVNGPGTRAYWNSSSILPDGTGWIGVHRYDLSNFSILPFFNFNNSWPPGYNGLSLADFTIGQQTEKIYFTATRSSVPYVTVLDLDANFLAAWEIGSIICFAGGIAVNCDESLIAVEHLDGAQEDIIVFDSSGQIVTMIDFITATGRENYRGIYFAQCPGGIGVVFPGIAKVPRVGTTQEWFTRTTP